MAREVPVAPDLHAALVTSVRFPVSGPQQTTASPIMSFLPVMSTATAHAGQKMSKHTTHARILLHPATPHRAHQDMLIAESQEIVMTKADARQKLNVRPDATVAVMLMWSKGTASLKPIHQQPLRHSAT